MHRLLARNRLLGAGLCLGALFAITLTLTQIALLPTHAQERPLSADPFTPGVEHGTPTRMPTYGNQFPPGFDNITPALQPPPRAAAQGATPISRDEVVAIGLPHASMSGSV